MSELRLIPPAVTAWCAIAVVILTQRSVPAILIIVVAVLMLTWLRQPGQAVLTFFISVSLLTAAQVRRIQGARWVNSTSFEGTVLAVEPGRGASSARIDVAVPGYPEPLTVFTDQALDGVDIGTRVGVTGSLGPATWPSLGGLSARGSVELLGEPSGLQVIAAHIRETFRDLVATTVTGEHAGLIPGMVVGDTSLQTPAAHDLYTATGLSHLSAVSGSNVTIVTTAALMVCRLCGLGPRIQTGAALMALGVFVVLVGASPSVLRAGLTGLVGLVAIVASTRAQPIHALALAVIVGLIFRPGLAVDWGFLLSVAATVGVVALTPVLAAPLEDRGMPGILARAIAVALAADLVTSPLIALMSGRISVVAVPVNVLVAPATAPITIGGLCAVALAPLSPLLAALFLTVVEPCAWWIHAVAELAAKAPVVTVMAHPVFVALACGWVVAGLLQRRVWLTLALVLVGCVVVARPSLPARQIDIDTL